MFVFGGENFLAGAHVEAAVDHRQPLGGAAGEGDLAGFGLQVTSGPFAHLAFTFPGLLQVPIHGQAGVAVNGGAVALNGFAHWPWV